MRETIQNRLHAAMAEAEARQESINHHTDRPQGSDLEMAHAVVKFVDLKRVMALVGEVVGMAEDEHLPNGEPTEPDTVCWAVEWRKVLAPVDFAGEAEEVAHDPAR